MAERLQQPLPTTCENTALGMPSFFVLQVRGVKRRVAVSYYKKFKAVPIPNYASDTNTDI